MSYFTELFGKNHEFKTGYLGWYNMTETETIGYPNQQQYRYRSLIGDTDPFARPDSVIVYDYPFTRGRGREVPLALPERPHHPQSASSRSTSACAGTATRASCPSRATPAPGPLATSASPRYQGEDNFPIYSTLRAAHLGDLRRHRRGPLRAARQLRPLRRRQLGRVGQPRARARPTSTRTRRSSAPTRTGTARFPTCPTRRS